MDHEQHATLGYACDRCELVEVRPASAWCMRCGGELSVLARPADAAESTASGGILTWMRSYGTSIATLLVAAALAFDPVGKWVVAPFALLVVLIAGLFLTVLFVARRELAALVRDRTFRVIHGLEHACIAILEERGRSTRSGLTTKGQFELDALGGTTPEDVQHATTDAVRRILAGETALAYSPRCGTSRLVALTLYAVIIAGGGVTSILLGAPMGAVMLGCAAMGVVAQLVTRPLGLLAQRLLTVSTSFAGAHVGAVRIERGRRGSRFVVPVTVV